MSSDRNEGEPPGSMNVKEFRDFMEDGERHGIAAMVYTHVHLDGTVTVYERGDLAVTLQAAILALEFLTDKARPPSNN